MALAEERLAHAKREELTMKAEEDLRKAQAQFELEKVKLDTERDKFKNGKTEWTRKAKAYKENLEAVKASQKVKGAELDNRAQTLSDLENRLKMDEKAITDGFENLESEKADFEAYMAEMQEQLRNEREELDNARELLETKTEQLTELKGSLSTKAKYMNDTARATEDRIAGLLSMGQVREAQREADAFEAWNDAEMDQIFNDLEEASDFAL